MFLLFSTSGCPFLVWFELYLHIIWSITPGDLSNYLARTTLTRDIGFMPCTTLSTLFMSATDGNPRPYTFFRSFGFSRCATFVAARDLRTSTTVTP